MKNLLLFPILLLAYASLGQITNVQVTQRTDGSGFVDVYFNLAGSGTNYYVSLEVSFDAGSIYVQIPHDALSGDIGPIMSGTNKHVVWNGMSSFPETYSTQTRVKVLAAVNTSGGSPNPCPGTPTVTDVDGNTYQTVMVGPYCWLAENLKTTKYRNGASIEYPANNTNAWTGNVLGAYAWYNNDPAWKNIYGALYNWHAVNNINGLCPSGWHVSSQAEWEQLISFAGGENVAGSRLRSCRQVNSNLGGACATNVHPRWEQSSNYNGTNDFWFSAFPGGNRSGSGSASFQYLGSYGYFWTSTEMNNPISIMIGLGNTVTYGTSYGKSSGYSVRCVKDY